MDESDKMKGAGAQASDPTLSSDPVARIQGLLGPDVVLIPVVSGEKRPLGRDWQKTQRSSMDDPAHLARLRGGNIGVLLGSGSDDLVSIDCDTDEAADEILQENPALLHTLHTKGSRGMNIWLRMVGTYPNTTRLISTADGSALGEFRAGGSQTVVHGVHPSGCSYRFLNDLQPCSMAFGEIKWPENWSVPWRKDPYDELVELEGSPIREGRNGSVTLNQPFFLARFLREHEIIFDRRTDEFVEYGDRCGLWRPIGEPYVKKLLSDDLKVAADLLRKPQILTLRNNALLTSLTEQLKGHAYKDVPRKGERVIHCRDGMLHLRPRAEVMLTAFSPDYYSRSQSPIAFDEKAKCPRFVDEFLGAILNPPDIDVLQKYYGMVLLGENLIQRLLIMVGVGGGGKGIITEVLEGLIGDENVAQLRTTHLTGRFETFGYIGKHLLCGRDVPGKFLEEDGAQVIKALTGGDRLDAEKKNGNVRVTIEGRFNVLVVCNASLKLCLQDDRSAWRRRLMIIPFTKPLPTKPKPGFSKRLLLEEGPGILNWALEGIYKLDEDIQLQGDISLTEEHQNRIESLLGESDSIREFVSSCVVSEARQDLTTEELVHAYVDYCRRMSWSPETSRAFQNAVGDLMLEIHRTMKRHDIWRNGAERNGFAGVRLRREGDRA